LFFGASHFDQLVDFVSLNYRFIIVLICFYHLLFKALVLDDLLLQCVDVSSHFVIDSYEFECQLMNIFLAFFDQI
jgi:hypothetical protein